MDSPSIRRNARSLDFTTSNIFALTPHGTSPTSGDYFSSTDQTNTELTSDLPSTPSTPHTPPPWLTVTHDIIDASAETETEAITMDLPTELSPFIFSTDQPPLVNLSPSQPRRSTRAVATGFTEQQTNFPIRVATTMGIEGNYLRSLTLHVMTSQKNQEGVPLWPLLVSLCSFPIVFDVSFRSSFYC